MRGPLLPEVENLEGPLIKTSDFRQSMGLSVCSSGQVHAGLQQFTFSKSKMAPSEVESGIDTPVGYASIIPKKAPKSEAIKSRLKCLFLNYCEFSIHTGDTVLALTNL